MIQLIDNYCLKDYDEGLREHNEIGKPRTNIEKDWHSILFAVGLIVEAVAIVYYVGFKVVDKSDSDLATKIANKPLKILLYLLPLIALLLHQWYIKNTFIKVNEITTHHFKDNPEKDLIPNNLMFSSAEFFFRYAVFLLLAVVAGEIPYILLIVEKVISPVFDMPFVIANSLTLIFITTCFLISFIVFLWDLVVFRGLYLEKINSANQTKKIKWYSLTHFSKIIIFSISGALSLGMWFLILLYSYTGDTEIMETVFYGFGVIYFVFIVVVRLIILRTNPFEGDY